MTAPVAEGRPSALDRLWSAWLVVGLVVVGVFFLLVSESVPRAIVFLFVSVSLPVAVFLGIRWHRSELRKARAALRESEEQYRSIVESSKEWIWESDLQGNLTYTNPGVTAILGYSPEEVLERPRLELVHPEDQVEARSRVESAIVRHQGWFGSLGRWRRRDGSYRYLEASAEPILDPDGEQVGFRGISRDVTERQRLQEQIVHQAFYDSLTGMANRALVTERLSHALAGLRRRSGSVAFLLIDLDGFKAINDTMGHATGDKLLVQFAERLKGSIRPGDTAGRLGGDEFGVVLEEAGTEEAVRVAQRILQTLRDPFKLEGWEVFADASIGITDGRPPALFDELMRNADAAMYAAKRQGRGSFEIYEPSLHDELVNRLQIGSGLRRALEQKEFTLVYQPVVTLPQGRIVGVEALLRWTHPTRGLVPPLDFIPLAEESGLIVEIDRWVLGEACAQLRRWRDRFGASEPFQMHVNISARQLHHPELVPVVRSTVERHGIQPGDLTLEITESVLMQDTEQTMASLADLRELGVKLAIDDFGIGFSSLAYLRRLPADVVKIDRSFVAGVATGAEEWGLARGIIRLVHGLGLETVAEGIEQAEQVAHLQALGCRQGQGYYFARPAEVEAIEALLQQGSLLGSKQPSPRTA